MISDDCAFFAERGAGGAGSATGGSAATDSAAGGSFTNSIVLVGSRDSVNANCDRAVGRCVDRKAVGIDDDGGGGGIGVSRLILGSGGGINLTFFGDDLGESVLPCPLRKVESKSSADDLEVVLLCCSCECAKVSADLIFRC